MANSPDLADGMAALSVQGRKPKAKLTTLAKKYGHPYRNIGGLSHRVLKNTGKSGLTPLSPFLQQQISMPLSAQQQKRRLHYYQQHRYFGFTAAELRDLEVLSALDNRPMIDNLANGLHPLFVKSQWDTNSKLPKHLGLIPILGGHDGFWQVDNDIVWEILEPPLKLASRLLACAHYYPWWDALFNGEYRPIEDFRKPPDRQELMLSFHQRHDLLWTDPYNVQKLQDQLKSAAGYVRFGLHSGYNSTETGLPQRPKYVFGVTSPPFIYDYRKVHVSIEMLQPLLRTDLTDAERVSNYFRIATTIIHETAHAIWDMLEPNHPRIQPSEPYFEDEPLCEIGWSLEDKLWGGEGKDIVGPEISDGGPGLGNMGIMKTKWFTDLHEGYRNDAATLDHAPVPHGQIDPYYTYDYWAISTCWQANLFQPRFWDFTVRNMGSDATQMGPLTYGTRRFANSRDEAGSYHLMANASFGDPNYYQGIIFNEAMTDYEKAYWGLENSRRQQAIRILQRRANALGAQSVLLSPDTFKDGVVDAMDTDDTSDEEEDEQPVPSCPRWFEITEYLFENRNPLELALDTMTFDIPEGTLYRYIQDRGGLDITPAEFRDFLLVANSRDDLFKFWIENNTGIVARIDNGWPSDTPSCVIPPKPQPSPTDMQNFDDVFLDRDFQKEMWQFFREFRDIEYEGLRRWVNRFIPLDEQIQERDIEDIIFKFGTNNRGFLELGPKGIARLTLQIPFDVKDEVDGRPPDLWTPRMSAASEHSAESGADKGRNEEDARMQEEVDLENFEKEFDEMTDDIGSDEDFSDVE